MDALADLVGKLDFTVGEDFEQDVRRRFGIQVNHTSPCPRGSFLLLATFRRSLVRLTEESVALILESCLGGHAPFFHVVEVSHNHFRFAVSCKKVGFSVYNLRRVIGSVFDVYFHLWSNGALHWEREKRLWEAEEERKWSKVLTKSQKRAEKKKSNKRVIFAKRLVSSPPLKKSVPSKVASVIRIGSFDVDIPSQGHYSVGVLISDDKIQALEQLSDERFGLSNPSRGLSGILKHSRTAHLQSDLLLKQSQSLNIQKDSGIQKILNFGSANSSFVLPKIIDRARRMGGCTRCFGIDHRRINCHSPLRCAGCFNYGHKLKFCYARARPRIFWRPKTVPQSEMANVEVQETERAEQEAHVNSLPIPNKEGELENPTQHLGSPPSQPASPSPVHLVSSSTPEDDQAEETMANFAVDPAPFIPLGLELEDWARPARGRIVISGNPPRRHEENAIATVYPPPPQNHLYEAMEEVVDFFEQEYQVRVLSSCMSPLGLCLVQFHSPVARQAMVNLSPHQLDHVREIVVEEHDRGLNLRNCPFTRTCWVMFLAFPLDFQSREIISQAVGLFGNVITWTNNTRCRSRVLVRCNVTLVSRVPRSLLVCQGNPVGDNGNSWSVPVFVLSSHLNDVWPADEDQIPPNGNPHPVNGFFLNGNHGNPFHGHFEDVGDLGHVQQENVNHGWQVPPQPEINNDWAPWPV